MLLLLMSLICGHIMSPSPSPPPRLLSRLLLVLPALQLRSCAHAPTLSRLSCRSTRGPLHDEREANVPEALIKAAEGLEANKKCEVRWQGRGELAIEVRGA